MRRIILEAVPQSAMRPPYDQESQAGDWYTNAEGDLVIRAIGVDLDDHESFLFAFHELIEAKLCRARQVSQASVDAFDETFDGEGEPGDAPGCPYGWEHRQAMILEHLLANFLGLAQYGSVA